MGKWLGLVVAISGIIAACSDDVGRTPANRPTTSPAASAALNQSGQVVNVTQLWAQNCANCHGQNGEGGGAGTGTLLTKELFDQKHDRPFFDAIKNGVPDAAMPAYGPTMSDEEIWALVVHIRELQVHAWRAAEGVPTAKDGVYPSQHHSYRIETVVEAGQGLSTPWAIDWLPDGRMLVTNKPGKLVAIQSGKLSDVEGVPPVRESGQGGLLDVAVHPDYRQNGWVYLAYSDPSPVDGRASMTKIVRGKLKFNENRTQWTSQETIFEVPPENYTRSQVHFGCRIAFDRQGFLFFSVGERGNSELAQDLTKANGKVFRLKDDGAIPPDNPLASEANRAQRHLGAIWSYGHRNPQGLTFDLNGTLWDTEHGPRGGDEVNRIQKGANYGWPLVAFSINYNDSPYRTPWPGHGQNFIQPVFRWLPSIGACGLDVARGPAFPKWKGDLLAGGLAGQNVDRLRIRNDQLVEREELVQGMGRVRDVVCGPGGAIYVVLNQPDKIVRLVPAG